MNWLAKVWAALKVALGAGDKVAEAAADAAVEKRANADLVESAANVEAVDRVAAEARTDAPDERTPPASPAARRPQ